MYGQTSFYVYYKTVFGKRYKEFASRELQGKFVATHRALANN